MKSGRRILRRKVTATSLTTPVALIAVSVCAVISFFYFSTRQQAQLVPLYTVKTTSDTVVAGACVSGGVGCSLRGAIEAANAGTDSIIGFAIPPSDPFCAGGICQINLSQALPNIAKRVRINGPGANRLEVRRATNGEFRIFTVTTSDTVTVSGLLIAHGSASHGGGILQNGAGILNVTNCVLTDNFSRGFPTSSGGGIANLTGEVRVTNSAIHNNNSGGGAGTGGGGIYNQATLIVVNSTIAANGSGNNPGTSGGGIQNLGGTTHLSNSTIVGNFAPAAGSIGGGISNTGGVVNVKSSIIALNSATTGGQDVNGNVFSAGYNLIGKIDGSSGFNSSTDQSGSNAAPLNPMVDPAGLRNNGGSTPTLNLLLGSPAIDKGSNFGVGGDLTTDQRGATFPRTFDNPRIVDAPSARGTDIGALERRESQYDFDGDGKTDIGIFRPNAAGEWWINPSFTGVTFALQFGAPTDRIAPADFTGDGKADIAFWRPSTGEWYVLRSEDGSFFAFPFGANGDIPAPADYDGDGKADPAVFRPSIGTWFISQSAGDGTRILQFGINGDQPVAADYDGDGRADIGIFRPAAGGGEWWINRSTAGSLAMQFGAVTDKPVQGDYTGDGKADVAIWRPSSGFWFIVRSEDSSFFGFPFGTNGDVTAPGDYDGDGKADPTVFRPPSGTWFSARTSAGTQIVQFGSNGDRPIPNAFVP